MCWRLPAQAWFHIQCRWLFITWERETSGTTFSGLDMLTTNWASKWISPRSSSSVLVCILIVYLFSEPPSSYGEGGCFKPLLIRAINLWLVGKWKTRGLKRSRSFYDCSSLGKYALVVSFFWLGMLMDRPWFSPAIGDDAHYLKPHCILALWICPPLPQLVVCGY